MICAIKSFSSAILLHESASFQDFFIIAPVIPPFADVDKVVRLYSSKNLSAIPEYFAPQQCK
jgi:hypothetical protein